MKVYTEKMHSFVLCAYGECEYLAECAASLAKQETKSRVLIATSTPNEAIRRVAEGYGWPLHINTGESGIAGDWNFAISCADTPLVTIAHQDDVYEPEYVTEMLRAVNRVKDPILFFSAYAELRRGQRVTSNRLLRIKKLLLTPVRVLPGAVFARRLSLAFGDPIGCPSVTYVKSVMERHPFRAGFRSNLDWQEWEELSREKGRFVYCPGVLMAHRIHENSETSRVIGETGRREEDLAMFRRFWPEKIARLLTAAYASSEKSNRV